MNYQVTARKWRPQNFQDIIGQDSLVRAVRNSLSTGMIPHAYLFSGIRGVGKTTTARIIAKALNCQNIKDFEPCNQCSSCLEITGGHSLDVIEIDGASNRGIDNIRDIRDSVSYLPLSGKYKIFIIDEVHMLTNEASNALLKTLEEPPQHAVFILATTEAHKVIPTIRSRCQHYVFKKIPVKTIMAQLKKICEGDKIDFNEEALYQIALAAEGSMRDAQSLFDQVVLYTEGKITEKSVMDLLGIPDAVYFSRLIQSIEKSDPIKMIETMHEYLENYGDIKLFVKNWINFLKSGMLVKKISVNSDVLDLSEQKFEEYQRIFQDISSEDILHIIQVFVDLYKDLKGDTNERFLLEIALFKSLDYKNMIPLSVLRNEIMNLSKSPTGLTQKSEPAAAKPNPEIVSAEVVQPFKIPVQKKNPPDEQVLNEIPADVGVEVTEETVKKSFQQVLSDNLIMRPMLKSIIAMKLQQNSLYVSLNTDHSCEYLTKNKVEIQEGMFRLLQKRIQVHFEHNQKECEEPANSDHNKSQQKTAAIQNNPAPEKQPETKTQEGMVEAVISLFDGKVK